MRNRFVIRVTAPTVALAVLLFGLGVVSAWYVHRLQRDSSRLLSESLARQDAAQELEIITREVRYNLREFVFTGDDRHLNATSNLRREGNRWIVEAHQLAVSQRAKELIARIERGYKNLFEEVEQLKAIGNQDQRQRRIVELINSSVNNDIIAPAHELRHLNQQAVIEANERNQEIANRLGLGLVLLGACGSAAGLLAGFAISFNAQRSVARRMEESHLAAARAQHLAAIGQLAAGLAHELRNPLTTIKMLIDTAAEQGAGGRLEGQDLQVVGEEVTRLNQELQEFLDFARPPRVSKRRLDLRAIVTSTVEFLHPRVALKDVEIAHHVPDRPTIVEADREQLRQLLLNLLLNALDASGGKGRIDVSLAVDAPASEPNGKQPQAGQCRLEVADRGPGLPDDVQQKLFEPFFTAKETGLGLGLAICQRIVEQHGGTIAAANRPHGGAVFTVVLPTAECDAEDPPPPLSMNSRLRDAQAPAS